MPRSALPRTVAFPAQPALGRPAALARGLRPRDPRVALTRRWRGDLSPRRGGRRGGYSPRARPHEASVVKCEVRCDGELRCPGVGGGP